MSPYLLRGTSLYIVNHEWAHKHKSFCCLLRFNTFLIDISKRTASCRVSIILFSIRLLFNERKQSIKKLQICGGSINKVSKQIQSDIGEYGMEVREENRHMRKDERSKEERRKKSTEEQLSSPTQKQNMLQSIPAGRNHVNQGYQTAKNPHILLVTSTRM